MTAKFIQKNLNVFGRLQTNEATPATVIAADVIATTESSAGVNRETEEFQYIGDNLSRDAVSTLKDESAEVPIKTFMPILGTLNPSLAVADVPLSAFFQASGGDVAVNGSTGVVTITNSIVADKFLTIDARKRSSEVSVSTEEKSQIFDACRGTLNVSVEVSSRTILDFNFLGNVSPPTMQTILVPDFKTQKVDVATVARKSTILLATLKEVLGTQTISNISNITGSGTVVTCDTAAAHGLTTGQTVTIAGTTNYDGSYVITVSDIDTFTFSSTATGIETVGTAQAIKGVAQPISMNNITAPNFFGFAYERFLLSAAEGYTKSAEPSDVNVTILEDEVGGTDFDPEPNIQKFYELEFKYGGNAAGKDITLLWTKLQLATTQQEQVAQFNAHNITFRNTGNSIITLE